MTLLSDIIQQGYRDANIIPIGSSPSTNELAEGLKRLQVLILSVLGMEGGEKLTALPIGNNNVTEPSDFVPDPPLYLPLNANLVCNLTEATTLYLHPKPQDGSRLGVIDASANFATYNLILNGNGRKIDGATTTTLTTNSQATQYFYRADLGDWVEITSLASSDEMPFPIEFDDLFVIMLAMRINPRNAQKISEESVMIMERSREQFRARYAQSIATPADLAVLRLSRQTFPNGQYGGSWVDGWA